MAAGEEIKETVNGMKFILNMSIRKKVGWLFAGCFLLFLACAVLILRQVYQKQIYGEMVQRGHYEDELIENQLERLSQNVESCCNNIIINLNLSTGGYEGLMGGIRGQDQRTREKILGIIDNNFLLFPDISEIRILYNNGNLYMKERNRDFLCMSECLDMVEEYADTDVDTLGMWYYPGDGNPSIYYLKVLNDVRDNSQTGYILLELEEKVIYESYRNQSTENPSRIYVFDENNCLISSNNRELMEELYPAYENPLRESRSGELYEELQMLKEQSRNYCIQQYRTSQGWTIVSVLDINAGMQGLHIIMRNIVLVSILLMILFFWCTLRILRRILEPIAVLAHHMRETGESVICKMEEPGYQDEVGTLISSFNQMVDMNDRLIQKVVDHEREKRHLELSLLQMQIKPHFLYNTLDTVFCLNSMKMYQEANYVVKQLAGYYRLVLNHGDEWISFSEELEAVKKYLDIQSVRYRELISYTISVDEELQGFRIPKLTLQPLVENAIYHGIKPGGRKGHILILGEYCRDEIMISVTDDGVGMSRERFEEIMNEKKKEHPERESFGMKSVAERLRLFYGENGKMELSRTVMGTSIVLSISVKSTSEPVKDTVLEV